MRFLQLLSLCALVSASSAQTCIAQSEPAKWQQTAEQIPSLKTLADSSDLLQKQIDKNGSLVLTQQHYRISRPLEIDLVQHGAVKVSSTVGSTLVMEGEGPAIRILGNHEGTASPKSFKPATWNQRMPIIEGIEILGASDDAIGIELDGTVGAILRAVSVRWCVHGIHLVNRNRNVVISDCHLYENSGIGVFLDKVNLHQINVCNSHVSYNRSGGIVVRDGNVRNLQITGCDIEGNMPADNTSTKTANVLLDVSASEGERVQSIAEVAITGCTIQHSANYGANGGTIAPGGANVRIVGKESYPINSVTITGNVISDTSTNIDIRFAHDVTIQSNTLFAAKPNNLVVRDSQRVVAVGNTFNPRQFVRPGTILFASCSDCTIASSTIHKFATTEGAVVLNDCHGFVLSGLVMTECDSGIVLRHTRDTTIANCRIARTKVGAEDLEIDESNQNILLSTNSLAGSSRIAPSSLSEQPRAP